MPTTTNRKLSIPSTGSESGVWGSNDLNPNFATLDGILGSVTTLNLAGSGPVTLTDTQQQVAVLRFTGILVANVQITVTEPAFWIIDNRTSGNFVVTITGGAGQVIATPQGSKYQVAFDGTDVFFVNLGEPGTPKKFMVSAVPSWITSCTINPYLPCRGGTALIATYPTLGGMFGTTFGGNGITTFGLPDLQGRTEFDLDNGAGRLTSATMTPDGNTLGATGGQQNNTLIANNVPTLTFSGTPTAQTYAVSTNLQSYNLSGGPTPVVTSINLASVTAVGSVNPGSPSTPITNIPPAMVTGITFVKT